MLRIIRTDHGRATTLRLEGRVTHQERRALDAACEAARAEERALVLDLAGVRFVDGAGAAALRALRDAAIPLTGCTPYVRALLEETPR